MFKHEPWDPYAKVQWIGDDASFVVLYLDIDDMPPDDVNEHTAPRIVAALNRELYPDA